MGTHQVDAFPSFQSDKLARYFYPDSTDGQYKLQSLAGPSAVLLKILIELHQGVLEL